METSSKTDGEEEHKEHIDNVYSSSNFVFDENDKFYMAPMVCRLMHYRNAAILCALIKIIAYLVVLFTFLDLQLQKGNAGFWFSILLSVMLISTTLTTFLMIYGIMREQEKLLMPQLVFMHVEIVFLILAAIASISSMSFGIQTTHQLFGTFVSINQMEKHFGPIWPFNMAVISFFGAATVIWSYIVIRGAYDYLLDKAYFTDKRNIEMIKTVVN